MSAGDVSARAYARQHMTHRVENVGKTTFEVIDIEFLKRPDGPTTEPIAPAAAENASARAYVLTNHGTDGGAMIEAELR